MSRPTLPAHFRASSLAANPSASTYQPGHSAHPSLGGSGAYGSSSQQQASPALLARIAEKKTELANLRELRDSSAQLATHMASLEAKLATLSDGTAAVACVLGNWGSVLQAISLASSKIPQPKEEHDEDAKEDDELPDGGIALPETLVRIPVQQADATARAAAAAAAAKDSAD